MKANTFQLAGLDTGHIHDDGHAAHDGGHLHQAGGVQFFFLYGSIGAAEIDEVHQDVRRRAAGVFINDRADRREAGAGPAVDDVSICYRLLVAGCIQRI